MAPLADSSGESPGTLGVRRSGRTHIKGIDDRVAPVTAGFAGNRVAAEIRSAREHERHRLESVAELFSLLGVLFKTGIFGIPSSITLGKTTFQFGKGARADRTEAAHCLPGQLLFDGQRPDDILVQKGREHIENRGVKAVAMASKIRNLFGQTDLTSREQNDADSDVESNVGVMGLKVQFPAAAGILIREFGDRPELLDWEDVRQAAATGYREYRNAAVRAATVAIQAIPAKIKLAPARAESYQLRAKILEAFLEETRRLVQPNVLTRPGFDWLLREVVRQDARKSEFD